MLSLLGNGREDPGRNTKANRSASPANWRGPAAPKCHRIRWEEKAPEFPAPFSIHGHQQNMLKRAAKNRRDYARRAEIRAHPTVNGVGGSGVRSGTADGQNDCGVWTI